MKSKWYSRILLFFVLIALLYYFTKNINQISNYDFDFLPLVCFYSFIATCSAYLLMFGTWIFLASSMDLKAPIIKTAKFYFLSQLGKYLPGNVGLFLLRLDAYKEYPKRKVAVGTIIEYIVNISGVCIASLIGLSVMPVDIPNWWRGVLIILMIIFIIALNRIFILNFINLILKRFKREPLELFPSYPLMLLFVCSHVIVSLLFGLGFMLTLKSIGHIDMKYFLPVCGIFSMAFLAGIIAPFAPGGIGIREGVLFLILPILIPKPAVIVGAILIRLIATGAELFLALVSYIIFKLKNSSN